MYNPYLNSGGALQPWDEPVTKEIPRQGDRTLRIGLSRHRTESGDEAEESERDPRRPPREKGGVHLGLREPKATTAKAVYSDFGESWVSQADCARILIELSAATGLRRAYTSMTVRNGIRFGWRMLGRRLSYTPFPPEEIRQPEEAVA